MDSFQSHLEKVRDEGFEGNPTLTPEDNLGAIVLESVAMGGGGGG